MEPRSFLFLSTLLLLLLLLGGGEARGIDGGGSDLKPDVRSSHYTEAAQADRVGDLPGWGPLDGFNLFSGTGGG